MLDENEEEDTGDELDDSEASGAWFCCNFLCFLTKPNARHA